MKDEELYWWIAINGASCAASNVPLPKTLHVKPVPQQLIGFKTRAEQLRAQRICLFSPIKEVKAFLQKLQLGYIVANEVIIIQPPKSKQQKPKANTIWMNKKLGGVDEVVDELFDE